MIDRTNHFDIPETDGAETAFPGSSDRPPSLGARLRAARERKGWTVADCAAALHLPTRVLERLEAGDLDEPEHFVFVRGVLRGYARHLGVPQEGCDAALRAVAPPQQPALVSVAHTSPAHRLLERYGTAAIYIVLTATIAVPLVWLGLNGGLERPSTQIVSLDQAPATTPQTAPNAGRTAGTPSSSPGAAPYQASMLPFEAMGFGDVAASAKAPPLNPAPVPPPVPATTTAAQHSLMLTASGDCWFQITDAAGHRIDSGTLHAGDSLAWHATGPLHVTLGNASAVTVTRDGKPFALAAYQHANVARFAVFKPPARGSTHGGEND